MVEITNRFRERALQPPALSAGSIRLVAWRFAAGLIFR
jgi:hypothetical protein